MRLYPVPRQQACGVRRLGRCRTVHRLLKPPPDLRQRGLLGGRAVLHPVVELLDPRPACTRRGLAPGMPGGVEAGRLGVKEGVDILLARQKHTAQQQPGHRGRLVGRVQQRQRGAPRPADHQPAPDAELRPQLPQVGQQIGRAVVRGAAGRGAEAGTALVEPDDAVALRVKTTRQRGRQPRPGAAVQQQRGLALGVAPFVELQRVAARHTHAGASRGGFGVDVYSRHSGSGIRGHRVGAESASYRPPAPRRSQTGDS